MTPLAYVKVNLPAEEVEELYERTVKSPFNLLAREHGGITTDEEANLDTGKYPSLKRFVEACQENELNLEED